MNRCAMAAITVGASLLATGASAMTVQEFLAAASRIPQNPTALLRGDTRRLMAEFRLAVRTVRSEQAADLAAGRPSVTCMPDKVSVSPSDILTRFNAIPAGRRSISVTQALREWMADRYPCPTR
jgi:hypothetical protein